MSTFSNVTWVAESKSRSKVVFTGKASGTAKHIINTVKTKLGAHVTRNKVKASEKFKLSLRKNDKTVDAWVVTPLVANGVSKKRVVARPSRPSSSRTVASKSRTKVAKTRK